MAAPSRIERKPRTECPERAPSVLEPERFPRTGRISRTGYTRRWAELHPPLSRAPIPTRSVCLSVSGAVAPSAPGLDKSGPGLSRGDDAASAQIQDAAFESIGALPQFTANAGAIRGGKATGAAREPAPQHQRC